MKSQEEGKDFMQKPGFLQFVASKLSPRESLTIQKNKIQSYIRVKIQPLAKN